MQVATLTSAEFARSMAVSAAQFAWLLGAGASAASNIPTGYDMILDFKTRLYCSETNTARREIDPSDPLWSARITAYFDNDHGLPPAGHPEEYAAAFEAVFPDERERRRYLANGIERGRPCFAHRVLASLIVSGQAPCLFTTNFDHLIERSSATAAEVSETVVRGLTVGTLDAVERAERAMSESDWPLLVKLHGDYQSVKLKNTTAELQSQDDRLRAVLVNGCNRFGLVAVGYSGRDRSLMEALTNALSGPTPFPGGLRWVVRPGSQPFPAVGEFMTAASTAGVDARFVVADTFDELAADINRQVDLPRELAAHVERANPKPIVTPVSLDRAEAADFPVLRCSALAVLEMPSTARRLRLSHPITFSEARAAMSAAEVRGIVAVRGATVVGFGPDADLLRAFAPIGGELDGFAELNPSEDSIDLGLIYDALVRALARGRPLRPILRRSGHALIVAPSGKVHDSVTRERELQVLKPLQDAYSDALVGVVRGSDGLPFSEGVRLRLECHERKWWCVFDPFTWVDFPKPDGTHGRNASDAWQRGGDPTGDWRKERWARRYNPKWSRLLDAWEGLLHSEFEAQQAIWLGGRDGATAAFRLSAKTAWARPGRISRGAS